MARVQLHIRAIVLDGTNAQVETVVHAVETLKAAVEAAKGQFGGNPDVTLDDAEPAPRAFEKAVVEPEERAVLPRPKAKGKR